MTEDRPARTQDLLTCFFATCENAFRFLERAHGYSYYAGMATYTNGRQIIRPYHQEDVPAPFFAVTRYEKGDASIEIIYGDTDFSLNIFFCPDRIHRFSMEEFLVAARKSRPAAGKAYNLKDVISLEMKMKDMAHIFADRTGLLIDIDEELIRKAVIRRARKIEKQVRDQFHKNFRNNLKIAARAFAEENYKAVVALLLPYERYLKKRDLQMLYAARESLIN